MNLTKIKTGGHGISFDALLASPSHLEHSKFSTGRYLHKVGEPHLVCIASAILRMPPLRHLQMLTLIPSLVDL